MSNTPLQDITQFQTDATILDAWLKDGPTTEVDFSAAQDGSDMRPSLSMFLEGIAPAKPLAGGPVRLALAGALAASTYNNGAAGVGATKTANANGALANIDGVAPNLNDRIYVWDYTGLGAADVSYGVYTVTQLGDGTHPWIMTRATDADSAVELGGAFAYVGAGTANAGLAIQITSAASAITLGTTPIGAVVVTGNSAVGSETARAEAAEASMQVRLLYSLTSNGIGAMPLMDAGAGLWWTALKLDPTGRIEWGAKSDGTVWRANGTSALLQIVGGYVAPGSSVFGSVLSQDFQQLPIMDAGNGNWWLTLEVDSTGRISWGIDSAGGIWRANGGSSLVQESGTATVPVYATDTNFGGPGNPGTGNVYGTLAVAETNAGFVDMYIGFGQSWDQATNAAPFDAPFVTAPPDAANILMLSAGLYPQGAASTSFVGAYAQAQNGAIEPFGPLAGKAIRTAFTAASIAGPKLLFVVAARGGTPYIGIKRGTTTYAQALAYVSQAFNIARANGQTLRVRGLVTRHGEQDADQTSRDAFCVDWLKLRADLDADIKAITGQSVPVNLFTFQSCDHLVTSTAVDPLATLAQLDMVDAEPARVFLSFPSYWIGPQDNSAGANTGAHYMAMGFAQMDEAEGLAIQSVNYGPNYRPLRLLRGRTGCYWSSATTIELLYTQPVIIDTSNAVVDNSQLAAYGFDFNDGSGSPPAISGVTQSATGYNPAVSGSTITFGTPGNPQIAVVIVFSGVSYSMKVDASFTGSQIAAGFAAAIPGASAAGAVLTLTGAPTSCNTYSNHLTVTLSGAPTGKNDVLRYACGATGTTAPGNQTAGRGVVRSPALRMLSAVARGNVTFGANPSNGDTVTVNGVAITFVNSGAGGNQVNIGVSAAASALALYTFLAAATANGSLNIGRYGMDATGSVVLLYCATAAGFTLAKSSAALTVLTPAAIPHYEWAAVERRDI